MHNPTEVIDTLELATHASIALVDMLCQLHASGAELPKHFDSLGALVAGALEEAVAEAKPALRISITPAQTPEVVASN
jgi:hypothetical protein